MQSAEAYKRFLLKINKNDTNTDIDISKGEFVLLYNEQKDVWLKKMIEAKETNFSAFDLERLQVKHKELSLATSTEMYSTFSLPDNFFDYISSYSRCSSSGCKDVVVAHYPFKPKNENMLLKDANNEPSLDYEETIVDLSDSKLFVYKKDFSVDSTYLNYYRKVGAIDIAGYRKLDGTPSENIDPDIDDIDVDEILNRCAKEVIRRYENPEGFQLAQERIVSQE